MCKKQQLVKYIVFLFYSARLQFSFRILLIFCIPKHLERHQKTDKQLAAIVFAFGGIIKKNICQGNFKVPLFQQAKEWVRFCLPFPTTMICSQHHNDSNFVEQGQARGKYFPTENCSKLSEIYTMRYSDPQLSSVCTDSICSDWTVSRGRNHLVMQNFFPGMRKKEKKSLSGTNRLYQHVTINKDSKQNAK